MKLKSYHVLILASLFFFGFVITTKLCCAEVDKANPRNLDAGQIKDKPMIIWFHSGASNSPESLKLALSSGLLTHVMLLYMHRADVDWKSNADVCQAIDLVKQSSAKLIWCRDLWPYYANEGIKPNDFYDPNYYVQEIQALRSEAKQIGADFVCLDTEPYGRSIMKRYLKSEKSLSAEKMENLRKAVTRAIAVVGKVDFVLPAGSARPAHPYYVLAGLGKFKISEYTYYDKKWKRKNIKWPNEIFGAYINTSRKNARKPEAPYFLVSDIFERSELWSDSKGLFLFPHRDNEMGVAEALASYAKRLPQKAFLKSEEPNSP